jgi:hypothetical protein
MQLVPLSTDGRVTAVGPALPVPGSLRVVLEPERTGIRIVALGPGTPRPVGRLGGHDAAEYGPVLTPLAERGLLGTCPARVTDGGALVLDLGPASDCVLRNSAGDLVMLAAERSVTVTREEHHQNVLAGRSGRVAVALQPWAIAAGKYAGQRGLEVTLDGRRVGELTRLMAERYLPLVDDIDARGRRAGCEALLRPDHRGVQVELRLPAVGAPVRPAPDPTVLAPAPRRPPLVPPPGRPVATALIPSPVTAPPARPRSRRLLGVAGAVVGVLVLASALGNSGKDDRATATSAFPAAVATSAPSTSTTRTPTPTPTPTIETVDEPVIVDVPATRKPTTTSRATTRTETSKPAPRPTTTTRTMTTRAPEPEAAPKAAPSGCDPNYSGCVPIASDVDCEGGSGNGPAYVRGPVRVIGDDIYDLDRGGEPGVACE